MSEIKKILVAPLDWGLGHASRCIPVIRYLLEKKCEVIIGTDKGPLALLKSEFPSLECIVMPGYDITYPRHGAMALKMAVSIPKIMRGIKKEHLQLQGTIVERKINAVISDNRFGLWSNKVPSVFITHQLMIKSPVGEGSLHKFNKNYISKYSRCWIPDNEGDENLSGDLSHKFPLPKNASFIGPLSRFAYQKAASKTKHDLLVLLSGPEPQRSIFEKKILDQLKGTALNTLLVQGIAEEKQSRKFSGKCEIVNFMGAEELQQEILSSNTIICRSGYSTVMDLAVSGKKNIVFVPTPGQTEQEYLAKRFAGKNIAFTCTQRAFHLQTALEKVKSYEGFAPLKKNDLLKTAVDDLLNEL